MEKLSIITVCYNAAEHIEAALHSVQEQQYPSIDHVVIDGGSTDGTLEILEPHRARLAYLVSEPDRGLYDAMNKGIEAATGDVLFFLNADDRFVDERVVGDMMSALEADPSTAMVYGDVLRELPHKLVRWRQLAGFDRKSLARRTISHQSLFVRKSVVEEVGGFSLDYKIVSDFHWLMRLAHSNVNTLHIERDVCIIGVDGLSNTTSWEMERLSSMREFYTLTEILLWRTLPWVRDSLPRPLRTWPRRVRAFFRRLSTRPRIKFPRLRIIRTIRRSSLIRSLRSWFASVQDPATRARYLAERRDRETCRRTDEGKKGE